MSQPASDSSPGRGDRASMAANLAPLLVARFDSRGRLLEPREELIIQLQARGLEASSISLNPSDLARLKQDLEQETITWRQAGIGPSRWLICAARAEAEAGIALAGLLLPARLAAEDKGVLALENLPFGLALFESTGRIASANPAVAELLAVQPSALPLGSSDEFWAWLAQQTTAPELAAASINHARDDPSARPHLELEMKGEVNRYLQVNLFEVDDTVYAALFSDSSLVRRQAFWKLDLLAALVHELRLPVLNLQSRAAALSDQHESWSQAVMQQLLHELDQVTDELISRLDQGLALVAVEAAHAGLKPESATAETTAAPSAGAPALLVVAEDLELQSLLKASLEPAGYAVTAVESGPAALENLSAHSPAGVVLDLSLSRVDGLSLCQAIRRRSQVPMLALSASSEPEQWMAVVEAGADDYLAKPFQVGDLLARTHALLRRAQRWNQPPRRSRLSFEELDIDDHSQQAYRAGQLLELTPTEFELLSYLAHNQGQVLTHGQLINALWPLGQGSRHALFVHINRLRSKIETDPANPHYVVTRWGLGYTFLPRRSSK